MPTERLAAQMDLLQGQLKDAEEAAARREERRMRQHEVASAPWKADAEGWRRAAQEEAETRKLRQAERAQYSRWCFDTENRRVIGRQSPFLAASEGKIDRPAPSSPTAGSDDDSSRNHSGAGEGRASPAVRPIPGMEQQAAIARKLMGKVQSCLARAKEKMGVSVADNPEVIFDAMDTDGSGALDANELGAAFLKLGADDLSIADVRDIVAFCDRDGDGTVDKTEFMLLVGAVKFD